MLNGAEALSRCEDLVARAKASGADAADAVFIGNLSQSTQVRLGALENVDRAESEHFGLRVFVGNRSATTSATMADEVALKELGERVVAMARAAPEDPDVGLAPQDMLLTGEAPDLDLLSPAPDPDDLKDRATMTEDAARANAGITNSEGASASYGRAVLALATSHGFARHFEHSHHSLSAAVVAGEGAGMQRGSEWRAARHLSDLATPEDIGRIAAERAVARLNPDTMTSRAMPVVFDPEVGGSLLQHLIGAISGTAIARRSSFLLDDEGEAIFRPGVTIVDEPLVPRGMRSRPFDGEGLPTARREIVADGVLTGWLMDSASAHKLGRRPTGHAARSGGGRPGVSASNLTLQPGSVSRADLIADIADGVLVTELIGMGVNPVTGDYSRGASGYRIVNGKIAGPVAGFTVAGNLKAMFAQLTPADDLEIIRSINTPTVRIDGMTVAGS